MVKDLCFEIIDKCPNECKFCSSNSCFSKNTMVSFDDFKRVIDYFVSTGGIEELSLSGGEPFLHPDIFNMIKYSKSLGIRTVVFTSGIKKRIPLTESEKEIFTNKMIRDLKEVEKEEPWNERLKSNIKRFYDNILNPPMFSNITKEEINYLEHIGLDKIVFDMQGYSYEVDSYLMGRTDYMHSLLNASLFYASLSNIEVDVHFVPMKLNYRELPEIMELLEISDKVSNVSILKFVPQGRGLINKQNLMLNKDEMQEFLNILDECKNKYKGKVRVGIPLQGETTHKCNAGLEKLDIKYDGTILPCPAFKELDRETMKKYGIKYYNIYENLEEVKLSGGKRLLPLCDRVYN